MRTVLAIDFDRWAAECYRANFHGVEVHCASVADEIAMLPDCDVILGGPPCQPFSDAGENEGESDERDCIPDFCAAVEQKRPRMFLMENVRGLLKEKHLPYFGRVLSRLEAAGYVVEYRLLDAMSFGVPQFRERVWVWGIRRDVYDAGARHLWPKPTHVWPPPEPCMFGGNLLPGVTVGQALGLSCERAIGGGSNPGRDKGTIRTVRDITSEPSTTLGVDAGNAMPEIEYGHGVAITDAPCPTLVGGSAKSHTNGLSVVNDRRWRHEFGKLSVDGRTWESRHPIPTTDEPMPTVRARSPRDGGRCTENCIKIFVEATHHDIHPFLEADQPAQTQRRKCGLQSYVRVSGEKVQGRKCLVRRLTPLECLRLQSGPDDYVWPAKITKTAMYRVVGNGWACAMGHVFAQAFAKADPASETVIDLFCGGGLGACGWHGRVWRYEHVKEIEVAA